MNTTLKAIIEQMPTDFRTARNAGFTLHDADGNAVYLSNWVLEKFGMPYPLKNQADEWMDEYYMLEPVGRNSINMTDYPLLIALQGKESGFKQVLLGRRSDVFERSYWTVAIPIMNQSGIDGAIVLLALNKNQLNDFYRQYQELELT